MVDDAAVDFLGNPLVEAAIAGLHVKNGDFPALGGISGEAAIGIAQHQKRVGVGLLENTVDLGDDLADGLAGSFPHGVENVVGLRLARQDKLDYALSVIVNSPVQIALVLAPALVLLSPVVGGVTFTLVFSPLLMAAVFIGMLVVTVIVLDGESTWLEGVALVGLYVVIATSFWWG